MTLISGDKKAHPAADNGQVPDRLIHDGNTAPDTSSKTARPWVFYKAICVSKSRVCLSFIFKTLQTKRFLNVYLRKHSDYYAPSPHAITSQHR
jgi:hypothetical protein